MRDDFLRLLISTLLTASVRWATEVDLDPQAITRVRCGYGSVVGGNSAVSDRQPKPDAARRPLAGLTDTIERPEQILQLIFRNATAVIFDRNFYILAGVFDCNIDG